METKTYILKVRVRNAGESEVNYNQMIQNFENDVRAAACRNRGSAELRLLSFEAQE